MSVYWIGLLVALSIAAPLGPVNVLCIRRTLALGLGASAFVSTFLVTATNPLVL